MRAALLREYGAEPELTEVDEPAASDGQAVVDVLAAGLNPVDLRRASGTFHGGSPDVPYVLGSEGTGRLPEGTRVYFERTIAPHGSFAERALIDPRLAVPLPEGLDDALAVCFGIAGLAAWLGLEWRGELRRGETVLILGASGSLGQIAVQAARLLGAGRVVAAARSAEGLRRARALGADEIVQLGSIDDDADMIRRETVGGPDLVLDPLWGEPAVAALQAAAPLARLVHVGESAGSELTLQSSVMRGKSLSILGHTNHLVPDEVRRATYKRMAEHAARGELTCDLERVPLDEIGAAWRRQAGSPGKKLVLIP